MAFFDHVCNGCQNPLQISSICSSLCSCCGGIPQYCEHSQLLQDSLYFYSRFLGGDVLVLLLPDMLKIFRKCLALELVLLCCLFNFFLQQYSFICIAFLLQHVVHEILLLRDLWATIDISEGRLQRCLDSVLKHLHSVSCDFGCCQNDVVHLIC